VGPGQQALVLEAQAGDGAPTGLIAGTRDGQARVFTGQAIDGDLAVSRPVWAVCVARAPACMSVTPGASRRR
jgi:hypothetical protein